MTCKEAIEKLKEILFMTGYKEALELAIKALEERPQGEWIDTGEKLENYGKWYRCSNCEHTDYYGNFCPNCGADMRKGGAEE